MIRLINALLAIVGGVGAALLLYWVLNKLAEMLPKWEERVKPWVFIGPAVVAISFFLVYPAIRTMILSFANAQSTAWVGTRTTPTCSAPRTSGRRSTTPCCGSRWSRRPQWRSGSGWRCWPTGWALSPRS